VLALEVLEDRQVPACGIISGAVYYDVNNNGLRDPGEVGLPASTLELVNAAGQVVATAVSGPDGSYQFAADQTVPPGPQTLSASASVPEQTTNWTRTLTFAQFNPALGTLTDVEVINSGDLTSQIQVANTDAAPQTITATVSGDLTLSGPGISALTASSARPETFQAAAHSNHDFGAQTVSGSRTLDLTDPGVLAQYMGGGTVTFTEKATGTSSVPSAGGNLHAVITSSGDAQVTILYHYLPNTCLMPGNYTILQTAGPPGYTAGLATAGNVTPIPGSNLTHAIPITFTGADLPNNNFAELLPGGVTNAPPPVHRRRPHPSKVMLLTGMKGVPSNQPLLAAHRRAAHRARAAHHPRPVHHPHPLTRQLFVLP
jgi:hypothetical protein